MRVLVTGGAGFIGSHITELLLADGHEVTVLDALLPAAWGPSPSPQTPIGVRFVHGDVRDADLVASLLPGVDAINHQAAMVGLGVDIGDIADYVSINDLGTTILLRCMAQHNVGRLVLASSMVVYGEGRYHCSEHGQTGPRHRTTADLTAGQFEPRCPHCETTLSWHPVTEDAPRDPKSVYAATKTAQENLVSAWAAATGNTPTLLRYHNVYGPRMPRDTPYAGVASIFRSALERHDPPNVFEDGGQMRDFVHVNDVARANVLALQHEAGGIFNVASGTPRSVLEMATELSHALDGPEPVVTGQFRAGDVRHIVASPALARDQLGFEAQVPFADGVAEFARAPLRG
jgi:dTDP-L-rhamnose 4-epimerase